MQSADKTIEVLYVGQHSGVETRIAQAAGLEFVGISAGKFRRVHGGGFLGVLAQPAILARNLADLFRVARGIWQCLWIIRGFDPDIIFIKGGFVGLPVGLAARLLHRPYVIHESDLEPGLTNRILAPRAAAVAVGFPAEQYRGWKLKSPIVFTGSPIRQEYLGYHRLEGIIHFKLRPELPVLLVTGGSQGAAGINRAVVKVLPELLKRCQIIHLTGENEIDHVRFELRHQEALKDNRYRVLPFLLHDMGLALAAADIVVARAGAQTIAELAALGKPTILVPNTQMAGHQVANAKLLGRSGAARVIRDDQLTGPKLQAEVLRLLDDPKEQASLSAAIRQFAQPQASKELAKLILSQARQVTTS